jgi:FkbM family methyltransferase
MPLHRAAVKLAERLLNARIVRPPGAVAVVFEQLHLKKLFDRYEVDCVFDVGANAGQYGWMLRERVNYNGPIVSFEPVPSAAAVLREAAAGDSNWHVEQVALDRSAGNMTFNVAQDSEFSSFHRPSAASVAIFSEQSSVVQEISIKTATLTEIFAKYADLLRFRRPFLKMDTQGHDIAVAEGAGEVLRSFVGLQSELSIRGLYEDIPDYNQSIHYYQSKGFELSAFVPNNEGHFPKLLEIDCIMYNTDFERERSGA